MKILDRYIASELFAPFALGVGMFTAIFLGATLMPEIAKLFIQGGSWVEVISIFLLSLPGVMVVTFPMAVLLSALLGFGRLSSELETVAALASGISMRRMAVPVLIAAFGVTVLDFAFQEKVVPGCAQSANRLILGIRARTDATADQPLVVLYPEPDQGRTRLVAYARKLKLEKNGGRAQGGTLLNVTVVYLDGEGAPELVAHAREARYEPKLGRWRMEGVRWNVLPKEDARHRNAAPNDVVAVSSDHNWIDFGKPPEALNDTSRRANELTVAELRVAIRNRLRVGMPTADYEVNLHHRFSVPFAATVFALIGLPLGLRRQRTGSSLGMGLSVLIIFIYYILWHYLGTIGKGGLLDPFLAAWIPNFVGLAVGGVLLQRAPK